MTFYYIISDNNSYEDSRNLFVVSGVSSEDEANSVFIENFFQMLPSLDGIDISTVKDMLKDIDFQLTVINTNDATEIKSLLE